MIESMEKRRQQRFAIEDARQQFALGIEQRREDAQAKQILAIADRRNEDLKTFMLAVQDREDARQRTSEERNDARQQRDHLQQQQMTRLHMQWQEAMLLALKDQQQNIASRQPAAITNVQNVYHNEQFSQSNNALTSTALLNNFSTSLSTANNALVLVDSRQQLALLGPHAQNAALVVQPLDQPSNNLTAATSSSSSSSTAPGPRRLAPRILNRQPTAASATGAHDILLLEDRITKRTRDERDETGSPREK
jgi:hypothetical protein